MGQSDVAQQGASHERPAAVHVGIRPDDIEVCGCLRAFAGDSNCMGNRCKAEAAIVDQMACESQCSEKKIDTTDIMLSEAA